jgi:nucleotide-binding universal stress UspA family protein
MNETKTSQIPLCFGDQQPIDELLVPVVDEVWSDRATKAAAELAERWDIPLRFVQMALPGEAQPFSVAPNRVSVEKPHIDIRATTVEGEDVAAVVLGEAGRGTVIVLSTDHAREWTKTRSVGETLVRTAPDPVILCGPRVVPQPMTGSVIVTLDGSSTAEAAIDLGRSMASSLGTTLWLVQVVDAARVAQVKKLSDAGERVSESRYLRSMAEATAVEGLDIGWEIIHSDDPVGAVVSFAAERGSSLIVAASHGASGLSHQLFGSTCLGFVERASVPVMIARTVRTEHELMSGKGEG